MNHENEGRQLLAPLRDVEPDIRTGVDIAKAKQAGRRTSRRRVIAGVAAAAGLAVLAGFGVPAVVSNLSEQVPPANTKDNVFKQRVTVGTAGGFTPKSYMSTPTYQVVELRRTDGGPGKAVVEVYRPEVDPTKDNLHEAAPAVHGREAFWTGVARDTLAWRWTDHAYATVWSDAPFPDIKDKLHKIALSVRPDDKPFLMPFTLPKDDTYEVQLLWFNVDSLESAAELSHSGPNGRSIIRVGLAPNDLTAEAEMFYNGYRLLVTDPAKGNSTAKIADVLPGTMAYATSKDVAPETVAVNRLAAELRVVPDPDNRSGWKPTVWR